MKDRCQSCSRNNFCGHLDGGRTPELFLEQLLCQVDEGQMTELFPEQLLCRLNGGHMLELFPEQL